MNEIPKEDYKKRGPKPKYRFDTMEVGKEKGQHEPCKNGNRDSLWSSLRQICAKHSVDGKLFKCYPTETGVFYYREV